MEKIKLKSLDIDVVNFIIFNNTASIEQLSNCFEVSQANIRNVLSRVESFVKDNNLGILLKDGNDYFFKNNYLNLDFDYTKLAVNELEKCERIIYILFKLFLDKFIKLSQLSQELKISRITLNSDLEIIKNFLDKFKLNLISIQWKGVFLQGDQLVIEKVAILFLVKLYLEEYFTSNLKKTVNPLIVELFKNYIDEETEKKITKLTNKLYSHFNIELGITYYYILKALIILGYHRNEKDMNFSLLKDNVKIDFIEKIYEIMSEEEKQLFGNNLLLFYFMSHCVYEKYVPIYSFDMNSILKDIFETFELNKNETIATEIAIFINSIYLQGKFSLQSYYILTKEDMEYLETDISKKFIQILNKHNIPFRKENIAFLYCYLNYLISESKKQNILIIDNGSLNWSGKQLKEKIKHLENLNEIDVISYFDFKFYSEKFNNKNKYNVYVFIDLPFEISNNYANKGCIFVNSYDLMFNTLEVINLFINN